MKTAAPVDPLAAGRGGAAAERAAAADLVARTRRNTAMGSLRRFAQTYLGVHFRLPPGEMHLELFKLLQAATEMRSARLAVAAPRGHAKSTLVSLAYILWCICYRREPYIVLISDTAEQAEGLLTAVKQELTGNDRILDDFPDAAGGPRGGTPGGDRWRRNDILTRNGVRVTALGAEQKIRGRRNAADRPTLIIVDDAENEELVRSPERRQARWDWFNKAVLKAGSATTNVVVVGTILHYDSMLARLLDEAKSPGWTTRKYRAVKAFAAKQELWERWESIYNRREDHEGQSGPEAAREYFEANRDAMLEGAEVLWPEGDTYLALMEQRVREGRASFDSEKQNEPVDPEDCLFMESEFRFWDDEYESEDHLLRALASDGSFYGACDPSLGRAGRRHDDSAIITVLRHRQTKVLYVLDADIRRRKPDEIIEAIIAYHRRRGYSSFGVESVQFQEFLKNILDRRARDAGLYLPTKEVKSTTDKAGRIQALQPLIASGGIRFSRRHILLLEQLRQFPHAAHDDGPDALQMAVGIAERPEFRWVVVDAY